MVYNEPTIHEKKAYCQQDFETLYPEVTRIEKPHEYYVDLTDKLRMLKEELIKLHTKRDPEKEYQKVKVKKEGE